MTFVDRTTEDSYTVAKDTSVPVVVMNSYNHHSLGIARSLGRLGIDVYGISPSRMVAGLHSRYFKKKLVWDVQNKTPKETIDYLLSLGKITGKRSLLINITDDTAVMLADYADALSKWYIFPIVPPNLVRSLISKKEMYFLAKKHNIPTAETFFPTSRNDVKEYLRDATFPIMFKGIDGVAAYIRTGQKMSVAKTIEEALNFYDRYEDPANPNFMLQEYIPGDASSVWMFNGYFDAKSDCLFAITGKKIRQYPVRTGRTSLGICVKNDIVIETTKRFVKSIGYKGILDIGYRYDKRVNEYKVLDVNPRIGSTFRLFVGTGGLDVARAEYLDLTGQKVPQSNVVEGRKWVVEDWDLLSGYDHLREKTLSIRQWIKSYMGVQEAGWFARDDLLPFLLMSTQFGMSRVGIMLRNR
jgi:D-aspartate ligase